MKDLETLRVSDTEMIVKGLAKSKRIPAADIPKPT